MSVSDSFQTLLGRIEPLASEVAQAESHAATIKTRLDQSFDLKKFMTIGSHSRNSAIRTYSDADYFAVLSRDDCRRGDSYISSATLLNKVRDDLRSRFPLTEVSRDGQAVVVSFGSGNYNVDVVPGFLRSSTPLHNLSTTFRTERATGDRPVPRATIGTYNRPASRAATSFNARRNYSSSGANAGHRVYQ